MSIKPEDVKTAVLDGDDLGHELRVGRLFEDAADKASRQQRLQIDFNTLGHGGTYVDSISKKLRQFDYRFKLSHRSPGDRQECVFLAVECKNFHPASPLVICGRDRTDDESYYAFVESLADNQFAFPPRPKKIARGINNRFYKPGEFVGKSPLRLKDRKGKLEAASDDDIYDKYSQALASSVELVDTACRLAQPRGFGRVASLVIPLVVVPDGLLWKVHYSAKGDLITEPSQVPECEFFVAKKLKSGDFHFVITHVHFVTMQGFSSFLAGLCSSPKIWEWMFPPGADPLEVD